MQSRIKIIRGDDVVTLVSSNGGRALAWLLLAELALLGGILGHLAAVIPSLESLVMPALASVGLLVWTASQITADFRMTADLATRQATLVRISPITGARTAASFMLDEVECLALHQTANRGIARIPWKEYVVALEMRGGKSHVMSGRGPLIAYQEEVARFSSAIGLGTRVVRLPAS